MKQLHHEEIANALHKAREKAVTLGQSVLLTVVKEVEHRDPLLFYSLGKKETNRFFLYNELEKESVTGIGLCKCFKGNNEQRFNQIEQESRSFLQKGETVLVSGENKIKPFVFGGFSFDERESELWKGLDGATFILPKFAYVHRKQHSYLMMNYLVETTTKIEDVLTPFYELEEEFNGTHTLAFMDCIIEDEREVAKEQWLQSVEQMIQHIKDGKVKKVVAARELIVSTASSIDSLAILRQLQIQQPNSFIFAFQQGERCFVGATPERLMKVDNFHFSTMALAGTIKRGENEEKEEQYIEELLNDTKNLEEHQIVVDMILNELTNVAEKVSYGNKPTILKTPFLSHLYTPIYGQLKKGMTVFQLIPLLHPTPALGGFPKQDALEIIKTYEPLERGWYGAPIGWLDVDGNGDFVVAIRSALLVDKEAHLFAGCGIVEKSIPELELQETSLKFTPMLKALKGRGK
ncbi:MAG: isochorismate synthase MenF [Bacillaceae bacterium]